VEGLIMKIGVLGSGDVGVALAKGFISEGQEVWLATRDPESDKGTQLKEDVEGAIICDYETAAKESDIAVLCVHWSGVEEAIKSADPDNLSGKVVIDTSNIMKQESGVMVYGDNDDLSAGEKVQDLLAASHVVKAFNTVGAASMYKPDFGDQVPTMFIAGNEKEAKNQVQEIVEMFGWEALDAGGIIACRSLEPMAPIWVNYVMGSGNPHHAFKML
jgi:predicted dinucleotide-binding enzyme